MDKPGWSGQTAHMKTTDNLERYRNKRDFEHTPEPAGTTREAKGSATQSRESGLFVVQEHAARSLHYDLRLEVNGVLKSWAVPKGPSTDPTIKRLAIATEDHPLEYATFEGVIPKGSYGAGKMIVWDSGTYRNMTRKSGKALSAEEAIRHGHLTIWLEGKKLRGGFALNRFKTGKQEQWLLVKLRDEEANLGTSQAAGSGEPISASHAKDDSVPEALKNERSPSDRAVQLAEALGGKKEAFPAHIEPMLAVLSDMPRKSEGYVIEYKWDGIRAMLYWDAKQIRLNSRNNLSMKVLWPELEELGNLFGPVNVILDGEIVALDAKNRVSFGLLSRRMHLRQKPTAAVMRAVPIVYMIFDILYLNGRSLVHLSYTDRRSVLAALDLAGDAWQTPGAVAAEPQVIMQAALENGIEGLVAKRPSSPYHPGKRSSDWLKIKAVNRQEFVIGGWIPLKGNPTADVGSLLLGYYDDAHHLIYVGKVGTGFTDVVRRNLKKQLATMSRGTNPFATQVHEKHALFVEPVLVAQVAFQEWTADDKLRHPSFKGLRLDKEAREVVRETAR
jgi:bifunctional non-homologous end joining protein LigD